MSDDDGVWTRDQMIAAGFDPDEDVTELPPMPWRELTRDDLRSVASSLLAIAEQLITDGENVPADLRVDLINLGSVDDAPHDLRMRAARLVRGFPN